MEKPPSTPLPDRATSRAERQAAALRANLRRRKAGPAGPAKSPPEPQSDPSQD